MDDYAILLSVKPRWWDLIKSGEKTAEMRKTRPNRALPIKVYVYASTPVKKVVGEFICRYADGIQIVDDNDADNEAHLDGTCLTSEEAMDYLKLPRKIGFEGATRTKIGYLWKISELVVYKKPRELREFGFTLPPQSWGYTKDYGVMK